MHWPPANVRRRCCWPAPGAADVRDVRAAAAAAPDDVEAQLDSYGDEGKEPNIMAKTMSWVKTNVKLSINESDQTIANLMTDGCNMGVKSLHRYLNQYEAADEGSKDTAKKLAHMEEKLTEELQSFL